MASSDENSILSSSIEIDSKYGPLPDSDDEKSLEEIPSTSSDQRQKETKDKDNSVVIISSDDEISCFECHSVISGGDVALMEHVKKEHWSSEESSDDCSVLEERQFNKCKDCGKYFSAQNNLRKHKRLGRCKGSSNKPKQVTSSCEVPADKENIQPTNMSNRKLGPEIWITCNIQEVAALPYNIDGLCVYKIPYQKESMMQSSVDGRPWSRWRCSSRKDLNGIRRVAECSGGYECINTACPYLKTYKHKNSVQFKKVPPEVVCSCCGYSAKPVECMARKIWEFPEDANYVLVYHYGTHKCTAIKQTLDVSKDVRKFFQENTSAKPSQCAYESLKYTFHENRDVEEVYKKAEGYADYKKLQNVKQKVVESINPLGHSFDAVGTIKESADKVDKYLIYKAEDGRLSGKQTGTFVFRTSREKVEMMHQMQSGGGGPLSEQHCFLDAEHDRVQKMKTINLSVEHPTLKELVTLASMDCQVENTDTLCEFWSQVNNTLRDFTGDHGYIYDPAGFITDEHGGNRESIRRMLKPGAVEKAKSCENHFYDCGHRQERGDWSSGSKKSFRKMLHEIYHAPTPGSFEARRRKMIDWAEQKTAKRGHVKSWFNNFWYKRRVHVFRAFKGETVPNTNMAEAGHSRNATRGAKNKSLATVAEEHIVECALLKSKLQMYENGTYKGGHCKTQKENETTTFRRQRDRAVQFSKDLEAGCIDPTLYTNTSFIDPESSHRAPKRTAAVPAHEDEEPIEDSFSSDSESTQTDTRKRAKSLYRKRSKRSKTFNSSLSMAKASKTIKLTKIHEVGPLKKVYELDESGRIRLVEISETPTCDCGMVPVKDIWKHVIWVMLKKLNVNENDEILHQKSMSAFQLKKLLKCESRTTTNKEHSTVAASSPTLPSDKPTTGSTKSSTAPDKTTSVRATYPPRVVCLNPFSGHDNNPSTVARKTEVGSTYAAGFPFTHSNEQRSSTVTGAAHGTAYPMYAGNILSSRPVMRPFIHPQKMPWHNNNPFIIVAINSRIKKCAGCPFQFMDANGPLFIGLVVRHEEKDFYPNKNGQQMIGRETNRYYHCEQRCLLNRHPYFSPALLRLDPTLQLDFVQKDFLYRTFNLVL